MGFFVFGVIFLPERNGFVKFVNNERGVTLIELLISIIILSIILLTFMTFFTNSSKYNSISKEKFDATNLVRETKENLKVNEQKADLQNLIKSVKAGPPDFQMASYPNLNLKKNIENIGGLLKLTLINPDYEVIVYIDPNAEAFSLYKFKIQVLDHSKLLSETYTYIDF